MYLVRSSVSNHNEYSPLWVAFVVSHTAIKLDPSTILRVHRRLGGSAKSGAAHRRATKRAFTARPLQARCSSLSDTSAFSRPSTTAKMLSFARLQLPLRRNKSTAGWIRNTERMRIRVRASHESSTLSSEQPGRSLAHLRPRTVSFWQPQIYFYVMHRRTAISSHYPSTAPNRHVFLLPHRPKRSTCAWTSRLNIDVPHSSGFPRYEHILITDDLWC